VDNTVDIVTLIYNNGKKTILSTITLNLSAKTQSLSICKLYIQTILEYRKEKKFLFKSKLWKPHTNDGIDSYLGEVSQKIVLHQNIKYSEDRVSYIHEKYAFHF